MSRVAFVFPGQGSQHLGMGRSLWEAFPESRIVFEEADDVLRVPLSRMCFEGSEDELALTENTQPAILAVSIAAMRALAARGVGPDGAAGHSLGEYSAHVAAGAISFRDAVLAVRQRGRFMQDAVPVGHGAMAAIIGLDRATAERVCVESAGENLVTPANLNGPDQTVIAGHVSGVHRAAKRAREAGAKRVVMLAVSAPFHCPLMAPAAQRLEQVLAKIEFHDPSIPVFCNSDARPVLSGRDARAALVRQVVSPVRWHETVEAMAAAGFDTFVEVGPGSALAGLVRRILKNARVLSVSDPESVGAALLQLGGTT